jgi:phospholipase/carboxylesterase
VIVEPEGAANAAVIWLHGLGADGYDFLPIVPELELPATLAVRFIFPHAEQRAVTVNGGARMPAWYDIHGFDSSHKQDAAGIHASAARIQTLIEAEVAAGVARTRIVLAGFSQGGAIVLHAGLRQADALAGVMALSTYLPLESTVAPEATAAGRALPVLMCHGRQDPVITIDRALRSRDALLALGVPVQWREYQMPHSVCPEEIGEISRWLGQRLV